MVFRTTLAAVGITVVAISAASPCHADTTTYLDDMHEAGLSSESGDADLLSGGWFICKELAGGKSRDQVAAEIVYESEKNQGGKGVDPKTADEAVIYANDDLCPGT